MDASQFALPPDCERKRRDIQIGLRSGADIDQVRRLARHKDVKTTLNYYAESDLPELAAALNRVPIG